MSLRLVLALFISFLGTTTYSQEDSLQVDTLFSWEEEWLQWCEQSSCVSTDTSLWNGIGEPNLELDTTASGTG